VTASRIAVIVTTYNRLDALAAVLAGLCAQTDRNFEVIVADDGSTAATGAYVRRVARTAPMPLRHVWHPDEGFRAAAIRNKGIALADADYLIFLDGDCVPQPDFVARHRALAEPGRLVTGSRILLSAALTRRLLDGRGALAALPRGAWLAGRLTGDVNKVLPLFLKLPAAAWRRSGRFKWRRIKSCNLAVWRSDALAVDGFDESFRGWGHEDADFVLRLHHLGVERTLGSFATEVFHLWHREAQRDRAGENLDKVMTRQRTRQVRADRGVTAAIEELRQAGAAGPTN
jgi:glycosyltransferase involved in cell wall biosynthesis